MILFGAFEARVTEAHLNDALDELAVVYVACLGAREQLRSDDLHDCRRQQISVEELCQQPQRAQLPQLQLALRLPGTTQYALHISRVNGPFFADKQRRNCTEAGHKTMWHESTRLPIEGF
jgi:hypothetical protein